MVASTAGEMLRWLGKIKKVRKIKKVLHLAGRVEHVLLCAERCHRHIISTRNYLVALDLLSILMGSAALYDVWIARYPFIEMMYSADFRLQTST